jgi:hypothetical protein
MWIVVCTYIDLCIRSEICPLLAYEIILVAYIWLCHYDNAHNFFLIIYFCSSDHSLSKGRWL